MNKRRLFLSLLTAAAATPLLPARAGRFPTGLETDIDQLLFGELMRVVPDNLLSRRLGRAICDKSPLEFNPTHAIENLFEPLRKQRLISKKAFQNHLDTLRQKDFSEGKTVSAAGWILARSEAEAIAIVTAYRQN